MTIPENEHGETLTKIHAFIDQLSAAAAPGMLRMVPYLRFTKKDSKEKSKLTTAISKCLSVRKPLHQFV